MIQRIDQPVSVHLVIDEAHRSAVPCRVKWQGQVYRVQELGLYHRYRDGRKVWHVFSVNVGALDMRLEVDGDTLAARLIEVSDGLPD